MGERLENEKQKRTDGVRNKGNERERAGGRREKERYRETEGNIEKDRERKQII